MSKDLYTILAQPARPTEGRYCGQEQGANRLPAAIDATATEAVETTDNDRAAVLLGTVSL